MKNPVQVFICMLVITLAGCKKENYVEEDTGPYYLPQEIKDYSMFKPGTYWVYIDSVSGNVDSMHVFNMVKGFDTLTYSDNVLRPYEFFETQMQSSYDGYTYLIYCSSTYSTLNNTRFPVFITKFKAGHAAGQSVMYMYKPFKGQVVYDANATKIVNNVYPSIFMSGVLYKNVIDISHDKSVVDVSNNARKFFASNFGLIRKEYGDSNQVWILARSHIIQ